MIKKGIIIIIVLGLGGFSMAQTNIQDIAREIISNNLSIKARVLENEMRILEDKGSMLPEDPEIVGAYLWGSPSFIGNRTNLAAHQKIKFPTYYGIQKNVNKISSELYDTELDLELNVVLFEIVDIFIDMASVNEIQIQLSERFERLTNISDIAARMFEVGETNRIEMEKAKLMVDTYRQDILMLESEESVLNRRLKAINSDIPLAEFDLNFDDFVRLFKSLEYSEYNTDNPAINYADVNKRLASAGIELSKTGFLPDLQMGYASEAINGEKLAGVEMGISIPLWGKPNQVKKAKIKKDLSGKRLELTSQIIESEWDNAREMANKFLEIKNNLEASLSSLKAMDLLEKSWELGEISLLDYLKELPFYYGVEDRVVEAEKKYYKALLEQNKYHLGILFGM